MCFVLYLSSDVELEESPQGIWTEEKSIQPFIWLHKVAENEKEFAILSQKLHKRHLYYVGSNKGCGCGFYCYDVNLEEEADRQIRQKNYAFISDLLQSQPGENFEMFACWEGDQWKEPERKVEITKKGLVNPDFIFEELFFYSILV